MRIPAARACFAVLVAALPARAQVIRGVVTDGNRPLPGAEVLLSDSTGRAVTSAIAGSRGDFLLRAAPGRYRVDTRRLGFTPEQRDLGVLGTPDTVALEIRLSLLPERLRTVEVQAERRALRSGQVLGMSLRGLDVSMITPTEVAVHAMSARTWLDIVRASGLSGLVVSGDCVKSMHAIRGECAIIVVDDIRVDDRVNIAGLLSPRAIDHVIYLKAAQATTIMGTGAPSGALFIYTVIGARQTP